MRAAGGYSMGRGWEVRGVESRETDPAGWSVTRGSGEEVGGVERVCLKVRSLPWIHLVGSELLLLQ